MTYTSIENEKIKKIKKLNKKKYRDQENLYLVEGDHLVIEAYKSGVLDTLIVTEGVDYKGYPNTIVVSSKVMKFISELDTPKKVMGICKKKNNEVIGSKVIVLDNVQDPGNLGTIIRSSVAFNFDTILISEDTVDPYNSKVIRACQGMNMKTNIIQGDLTKYLKELKDYKIYATSVTNGKDVKNIDANDKLCVVMGNEGNGVSEKVKSLCNDFIYINMNSECESLNVAVAASIIMYELS